MPMIRAMRMLNALEAGTLTGPGLDTLLLADPSRAGELRVLLDMPGQLRRMLSSDTTLAGLSGAGAFWSKYSAAFPALATAMIASSGAMSAAFSAEASTDALLGSALRPSVFASAPARAAMVASTLGMANLTGDATKFRDVLASQPVLDEVFARPAALAALRASTALPASAVPAMTSGVAPAGNVVTASGNLTGGFDPFKAFDKNVGTPWYSNNTVSNQWLRHTSTGVNRSINRAYIRAAGNISYNPKDFRIEYSLDGGTTWLTAFAGTFPMEANAERYFDVNCAAASPHWRVFIVNNHGASYIGVAEIDFFGFVVP